MVAQVPEFVGILDCPYGTPYNYFTASGGYILVIQLDEAHGFQTLICRATWSPGARQFEYSAATNIGSDNPISVGPDDAVHSLRVLAGSDPDEVLSRYAWVGDRFELQWSLPLDRINTFVVAGLAAVLVTSREPGEDGVSRIAAYSTFGALLFEHELEGNLTVTATGTDGDWLYVACRVNSFDEPGHIPYTSGNRIYASHSGGGLQLVFSETIRNSAYIYGWFNYNDDAYAVVDYATVQYRRSFSGAAVGALRALPVFGQDTYDAVSALSRYQARFGDDGRHPTGFIARPSAGEDAYFWPTGVLLGLEGGAPVRIDSPWPSGVVFDSRPSGDVILSTLVLDHGAAVLVHCWQDVPRALRLNQRNDGLGISPAPRLRSGNVATSAQLAQAPRVGGGNTYS